MASGLSIFHFQLSTAAFLGLIPDLGLGRSLGEVGIT